MSTLNIMVLRKKAREMGLELPKTAKKGDIVRAIQKAEGNAECFDSAGPFCPETACCWRGDCARAALTL